MSASCCRASETVQRAGPLTALSLNVPQAAIFCQAFTKQGGTAVGLDVDDIAGEDLFFLEAVIDGWVQLELLGALHSLKADDDVCDDFAIPPGLQRRLSALQEATG